MNQRVIKEKAGETFHFPSVNLIYDGKSPIQKLENYFLTQKGMLVLETVLDSLKTETKHKRISAITAPPGSGKSYLALFISTILSNHSEYQNLILKKIESYKGKNKASIYNNLKSLFASKEKTLPVFLLGDVSDYRKTILESILFSLSFECKYEEEFQEELFLFFRSETGFQRNSGDLKKLIERTTATFANPDDFFSGYALFIEFALHLGYQGIAIFHDEFNRFLSRHQHSFGGDLDFLQDLSEYNLRLKKFKVFHFLLLHKGISQYLNNLSEDRRKEWLKVEGRFHQINFHDDLSDVYEMISLFLEKNFSIKTGKPLQKKMHDDFVKACKLNPALKDQVGTDLKYFSEKSYPLHFSTLLALPLLCNLFGQNERTLFDYLSDLDKQSGHKDPIYIDNLFDYFDTYIDKLGLEDSLLVKWHYGRNALGEVTTENETKLIKILTLLSVINRPNILPPHAGWISFCADQEKKITAEQLERLVRKNLALFRESASAYQIYYGSSVNVTARISENENFSTFTDCQKVLDDKFFLSPIYGNSYNGEFFTSRFYSRKFILEESIIEFSRYHADLFSSDKSQKIDSNIETFSFFLEDFYKKELLNNADGVILFYLGSQNSGYYKGLCKAIEKEEIGKKFILLSSEITFNDIHLLKKYDSALKLSTDKELIQRDPRVQNDLRYLCSDLHEKLNYILKNIFRSNQISFVFSQSLILELKDQLSEKYLSDIVSEILSKRFPLSPKINCELINREKITPVIRNARKKIIREMLSGNLSFSDSEGSYGPDVTIFRSLFTAKRLVQQNKTGELFFNLESPLIWNGKKDVGLSKALHKIIDFFENLSEKNSIGTLYELLVSEPFGMYSEVIPFYLLSVLIWKNYSFSLYEDGRYEKEINSDVIEKLHLKPAQYKIRIIKSDFDFYLSGLVDLFETKEKLNEKNIYSENKGNFKIRENKIYRSVVSILFWFTRLPEYTKKTKTTKEISQKFLQSISTSSDPEKLILEDLPDLFGKKLENAKENEVTSIVNEIQKIKSDIEKSYADLIENVKNATIKIIFPHLSSSTPGDLFKMIKDFMECNQYKLQILHSHDQSFRKFYERIQFQYDSEKALIESLGILLCDVHPKYWKDDTILQYEFRLTTELSKLHIATLMLNPDQGNQFKIENIKAEFRSLNDIERRLLLEELGRVG